MGGKPGKLSKEDARRLADSTNFSHKELIDLYKNFSKDAPSGVISKNEFTLTMERMEITDPFLQDLVFNAFDHNRDGVINFKEFVTALGTMTRGTLEDKLSFAFDMYDLDGNGYISKEELLKIIDSFYHITGSTVSKLEFNGEPCDTADKYVDCFFKEMDENGDNQISFEEYKTGAMRNAHIIEGLSVFGGGV